jgi:hypothetical protein
MKERQIMPKDKREMPPESSERVNRRAFLQVAAAGVVTGAGERSRRSYDELVEADVRPDVIV